MYSTQNTVIISNAKSDVALTKLAADYSSSDTGTINIDDTVDGTGSTISIGASGQQIVYYIDDSAKNYLSRHVEPVFLFASSSETELKDNTEQAVDVLPTKVMYEPAASLKLTTNGMSSFNIQKNKFVNSVNNINIAAVGDNALIVKSDYEEFKLVDKQPEEILNAFEARITIKDDIASTVFPIDTSTRVLPLSTPGCGNFTVTPTSITPSSCLLYTSPSPRDGLLSRMPSSA